MEVVGAMSWGYIVYCRGYVVYCRWHIVYCRDYFVGVIEKRE